MTESESETNSFCDGPDSGLEKTKQSEQRARQMLTGARVGNQRVTAKGTKTSLGSTVTPSLLTVVVDTLHAFVKTYPKVNLVCVHICMCIHMYMCVLGGVNKSYFAHKRK